MYKVASTLPAVASLVLDCTSPNQNERRKDDQVISRVRDQAQTDRVTCKPWTIGRKSSHTCHLVARSAQSVSSIQHYHVWKRNRDPSNQRSRDQTCLTGLCERAYERSISARKSEKAGQTRPLRVSAQVESPLPFSRRACCVQHNETSKGHPQNVAVHDTWYRVPVAQPFSLLVSSPSLSPTYTMFRTALKSSTGVLAQASARTSVRLGFVTRARSSKASMREADLQISICTCFGLTCAGAFCRQGRLQLGW